MAGAELWFDEKRTRYFLVPEGVELLPGEARILSYRGGEKRVSPGALQEMEIPKEEAALWIDAEIQAAWGRARGAFQQLIDFGKKAAADAGQPVPEAAAKNPLPEDLRGSLGISLGQLHTHPEEARARFQQVAEKVAEKLKELGQKAQTQPPPDTQSFEEAAARQAAAAPEKVAEAAEKLKAALKEPALADALQGMGEKLLSLSAELRERAEGGAVQEPEEEPGI